MNEQIKRLPKMSLWNDSDMFIAVAIGIAIGIFIGLVL
jgi:hypothetical protein